MDVDLFKELIFDKKKREEWLKKHYKGGEEYIKELLQAEFNKVPYHTGLEPEEGEINHD